MNPYRRIQRVMALWPIFVVLAVVEVMRREAGGPWWVVPALIVGALGVSAAIIGWLLLSSWIAIRADEWDEHKSPKFPVSKE